MIIFVEPNGDAHTVDQSHEMALKFNRMLDDTFHGRMKELEKAFIGAWETIKKAMEPVIKALKAIGEGMIRAWREINNTLETIHDQHRNRKRHWAELKTRANRNWEWRLKKELKPRINFIHTRDWRRSKRFQHRQRT